MTSRRVRNEETVNVYGIPMQPMGLEVATWKLTSCRGKMVPTLAPS
jgi:hypothetical protein